MAMPWPALFRTTRVDPDLRDAQMAVGVDVELKGAAVAQTGVKPAVLEQGGIQLITRLIGWGITFGIAVVVMR